MDDEEEEKGGWRALQDKLRGPLGILWEAKWCLICAKNSPFGPFEDRRQEPERAKRNLKLFWVGSTDTFCLILNT